MCGRYRRTTAQEELARRHHIPIPPQRDLPISWNIAPAQDVLAIRLNPKTRQRTLDTLRWGLIPNWAKDPKIAYKTINARVETIDTPRHTGRHSANGVASFPLMAFSNGRKFPGERFRT
jgi:putative SOS response-associated peptidase YedK